MDNNYINYNLNETVMVRLTDLGRRIHREQYEDMRERYTKLSHPYTPPNEDENGWSKWQGWYLIETFGEFIGLGMVENPFELTIRVPVPKLSNICVALPSSAPHD